MTNPARRSRAVLLAVFLIGSVAGCASSASPAGSAAGGASASPTGAASESASASFAAAPTASASPATESPGFACLGAPTTLVPPSNRLEAVDVTSKPGYDEVEFWFATSGTGSGVAPSLTVESATSPFVHGASGLPLTVAGESFVRLTFREMIVADEGGQSTLTGPADVRPSGPVVREAVESEAFEGVVSWIVGSTRPGCVRVTADPAGRRVILDVRIP
jgi:hypothetical protein